ncbi:MAG: helix-turn-helix transcriptional regulator [Ruminococcus sp.]
MSKANKTFTPILNAIGGNIYTCRTRLGLTQEQLAKKASEGFPDWKLNRTTISRYEKGIYRPEEYVCMSSLTFFRFCEILEVHSSELYLINEGNEIPPYKRNECLETKETFKKSLAEHLCKFIITKKGEAFIENQNKYSKDYHKAVTMDEFKEKFDSVAEKMQFFVDCDDAIDIRTIYRYLAEKRIPSLDYLFLICKALEIEFSELIG